MTPMRWRARVAQHRFPFVLWLFILAILVNTILQPDFLLPATINSNLRVLLPLILVAVGQAVVILGGGIDISVGAIVSIVNAMLATQIGLSGAPATAAGMMVLALAAGMALGAVNGFFIAILRLQPIITTYATSFFYSGLALAILPNPGGGVPSSFTSFYRNTMPLGLPLSLYLILLMVLAWNAMRQARYGRYLFAVGGKADAAFQTGVPVRAIQLSTYVFSGLMSACGGIALTLLTGSGNAQSGDSLTLPAITAVVIGGTALSGGTGGIGGAITGAIVLGLFRNIVSFAAIATWWQTFVNAAIIVLALAMPGVIRLLRRRTA